MNSRVAIAAARPVPATRAAASEKAGRGGRRGARHGSASRRRRWGSFVLASICGMQGIALAAPVDFKRAPPPGFAQHASVGVDRPLLFRGRVYDDVVWVMAFQEQRAVLATPSIRSLRRVLTSAGFDAASVEAFLVRPHFDLGETMCLALAESPQTCVEVTLREPPAAGKVVAAPAAGAEAAPPAAQPLELHVEERSAQLVSHLTADELSLVGVSNLYAGGDSGGNGTGMTYTLGTTHRGVLSRESVRFEYDFAATTQSSGSAAASNHAGASTYRNAPSATRIFYNTLAAGVQRAEGTAYAGLFRGASGGQAFGLGSFNFFARPAQLGLAWQSTNNNLSSAGLNRRVRLLLATPSYVRILANGVQLHEAQLPAGDQWVTFSGFSGPFVQVIVRDATGAERQQRLEVQEAPDPRQEQVGPAPDRHLWYVDAGKVLDATGFDNRTLQTTDIYQASAIYSYLGELAAMSISGQTVNRRVRAGAAVTDRNYFWRASGVVGDQGERGFNAGLTPQLGDLRAGLTLTDYRPPVASGIVAPACVASGNYFCFSSHPGGYRSWGLTAGYRDVPLTVGALYAKDGGRSASTEYNAAWTTPLRPFGPGTLLMGLATYNPSTSTSSVMLTLILPLSADFGAGLVTAGYSTDLKGSHDYSAGYSRAFDPATSQYLRTVSTNVQVSQPGSGQVTQAGNAYLTSQLGPVSNSLSVSSSSGGTNAVNTSFQAHLGASPAGVAFARDGQGVPVTDLFQPGGMAAVTVINRSQEPQTVNVGVQRVEIEPNSNVLIPVNEGYLRDVSVTPGPVANAGEVQAGRLLYKGNIKSVTIEEGFWVIARFTERSPQGGASERVLPVRFTYKRPGEKLERLYASAKDEALLYEFKENGDRVERFITVDGSSQEYRCWADVAQMPKAGDVAGYKEFVYACEPLAGDARQAEHAAAPAATPAGGAPKTRSEAAATTAESAPRPAPVSESVSEPMPPSANVSPSPTAASTAAAAAPQAEVRAAVDAWAGAWQAKRLDAYFAAYGSAFEPSGERTRAAWEEARRQRILSKAGISVRLSDVDIVVGEAYATVTFVQHYAAKGGFSERSRKRLLLAPENGRWLIVRETQLP